MNYDGYLSMMAFWDKLVYMFTEWFWIERHAQIASNSMFFSYFGQQRWFCAVMAIIHIRMDSEYDGLA